MRQGSFLQNRNAHHILHQGGDEVHLQSVWSDVGLVVRKARLLQGMPGTDRGQKNDQTTDQGTSAERGMQGCRTLSLPSQVHFGKQG